MNIEKLKEEFPMIEALQAEEEMIWINPDIEEEYTRSKEVLTFEDIVDASDRLKRFSSFIVKAFPETEESNGVIESPLTEIPHMRDQLEAYGYQPLKGRLFLKRDCDLPISGSIKARGGIYEVLYFAEKLALESGLLTIDDDYSILATEPLKDLFRKHKIAVGSTGNLGLSIGIMSAKLGFQVEVHMSSDAKQWKKDMLRSKGVTVVEYPDDYSVAVEQARKVADADELTYFIDDENSKTLFLGYAVAALRLKDQLESQGIVVDQGHPLFVYLPCGVGGGPGGVAFGLKELFGEHVHCYFAEPTKAPCMTLGMMTGLHNEIAVDDIGIQMATIADGLAVGRASGFVGRFMEKKIDGCYTVSDDSLYKYQYQLNASEGLKVEPSAAAGLSGMYWTNDLQLKKLDNAVHIAWATGGSMVPDDVYEKDLQKGIMLI